LARLQEILREREKKRERLRKEAPGLFNGFSGMVAASMGPGSLGRKEKELIAVAGSVITRCEPCLAHHVSDATAAGATREEILEAAAVGMGFGGAPSFVFVRNTLLDFLDDTGNGEG